MFLNTTGYYIPHTRIPNAYFLDVNGLTDEWIFQRTGINTRSKATEEETMDVMCIEAVKNAVPTLPYNIKEVDLIIFASYTPTDTVATTAHVVQREFGMENAKAFLLSSACSSALNSIEIIHSFMATGKASKALLLSADRNSTYTNENDPKAGHLWGDAAVAMFFSQARYHNKEAEVIDIDTQGLGHVGKGPGGVFLRPKDEGIQMPDGRDVFIQACTYIAKNTEDILIKNNYSLADLSYFISHQANMRIVSNVMKTLHLPAEKALCNIAELGNTGSVSSPLVLAQNMDRFRSGDLVCLTVFGGGYSSGVCLLKF
ncbi:MAG: ketoacyl-ACP synthase III [Dysgonamonadaceae bacterium]|jgi:3-oxoacyl-[acyl-carrier-protein] synthase-3|nr:ketoacyl-ACP synthase III [Dysgonamonadaceae bacterium]